MDDQLNILYGSIRRGSLLMFATPKTFTLSDVWEAINRLPATRRGSSQNKFLDIIIEAFKKSSQFRRFIKKYISKKIDTHDAIREIFGYLPVDRTRDEMNPMRRLMDGRALEFMTILANKLCRHHIDRRIDFIKSLDPIDAEILLYCMMLGCDRPYSHILATFPKKAQEKVMTILYDMMMRDTSIDPGKLCVLDQNLYQLFLAMHRPPVRPDRRFVKKITTGMIESATAGHTHKIEDLLHHNILRAVDIPYVEYFSIPKHDARVDVLLKLRAAQQTHLSRKQIALFTTMHRRHE